MTHTLYQHLPTPTGAARGYVGVWTNSSWFAPAPSMGIAETFLVSLPSLESISLLFVRPRLYRASLWRRSSCNPCSYARLLCRRWVGIFSQRRPSK
jgi:hypothetical protein